MFIQLLEFAAITKNAVLQGVYLVSECPKHDLIEYDIVLLHIEWNILKVTPCGNKNIC